MEIKLHYQEKGEGEPMILLHGNGEDGSYFAHQMDYFSRNYRVIVVDTRGHGQSPRGTAPYTIAQFAEDLHDFMDELDISKAVILGFSDGANIAMKFVLKYPERIKALILNGGNLNPKGVKPILRPGNNKGRNRDLGQFFCLNIRIIHHQSQHFHIFPRPS